MAIPVSAGLPGAPLSYVYANSYNAPIGPTRPGAPLKTARQEYSTLVSRQAYPVNDQRRFPSTPNRRTLDRLYVLNFSDPGLGQFQGDGGF